MEVRTRRVSLGELTVAKRARDAGLGAPERSVVIKVGVAGELKWSIVGGDGGGGGGVYYACSEMVGWP